VNEALLRCVIRSMSTDDPYRLQRFIDAQQGVYPQVQRELAEGEKRSHWMWFIFPQIAGLGHSTMAQRYAIHSLDEAKAYLTHPVLGPRLRECTAQVNAIEDKTVYDIFDAPDDMKFHSSVTLFALAEDDATSVFVHALLRYFKGQQDDGTLAIVQHNGG
jgi:uncharacterized protein (DUF1810 family)